MSDQNPVQKVDPGKMNSGINRIPVILQFNKESGAFITYIMLANPQQRAYLNNQFYNYVDVMMDPDKEGVVGKFDDFKIILLSMIPPKVYERYYDAMAQSKIEKKYSTQQQLDILTASMVKLFNSLGKECEELEEMKSYIDAVQRDNNVRKSGAINNPEIEFISYQEEARIQQQQLAGGAHELHGPKSVSH